MVEQTVVLESTSARLNIPVTEDPRFQRYTEGYFQEFTRRFPDLTAHQIPTALGFSRELAEEKLTAEIKIEQLEQEKAALLQCSDRDPYNPEVYSTAGWQRAMKTKLAELRRDRQSGNKQSLVIIAFDIDCFKLYNDQNNHNKGDQALGLAGQLAKNTLRPTDLVARIHGDEYVAVLETNLEGGIIAAERIRAALAQLPSLLATSIPLTASLGVAVFGEEVVQARYDSDEQLSETLKQAYELVDRAQYKGAKHAGKNRVGVMLPDNRIQTAIVQLGVNNQPATIIYRDP